ncbi:MAG: radical SAM protein, partial [Deltaproteobacteria bacterium]
MTEPTHLRVGPAGLVVAREPDLLLRVDHLGRWATLRTATGRWRRCLDGGVVQGRGDDLVDLDADAAADVHRRVGAVVEALRPSIDRPDARAILDAAMEWDPERLAAEAGRYAATWPEPTPILPPDRQRDLVLLPATGCPSNHCTFCSLYAGRGFSVLGPDALEAHLRGVAAFMGPGLGGRDGFYLGSASALSLSAARLRAVLDRVGAILGTPRRGLAAFWDPEHAPLHPVSDLAQLADRGLRRVVIGLETGDPALRAAASKAGDLHRLRSAIHHARQAGLQLGLTVLVGLGGPEAVSAHQAATARLLAELPLTHADLVYLS